MAPSRLLMGARLPVRTRRSVCLVPAESSTAIIRYKPGPGSSLMSASLDLILDEIEALLAELATVLDANPEMALHDPEGPRWLPRDVYNHLARWTAEYGLPRLSAAVARDPLPDIEGIDDEINARFQAEDAHRSHADARERCFAAYRAFADAARAVPEERRDAVFFEHADRRPHLREHLEAVRPFDLETLLVHQQRLVRDLAAALDADPTRPLHDPDGEGWIARDVYTHFTAWVNHTLGRIEEHLAGLPLTRTPGTTDEINARFQAEGAHLSHEDARGQFIEAYERLAAALRGVPEAKRDRTFRDLAEADGPGHLQPHVDSVLRPA